MSNQAAIIAPDKKMGVYLHWDGGQNSVEVFLHYCELHGSRSPNRDPYDWARLCQIISNLFGDGLSVGVGLCDQFDTDNWDNDVYIIEGWRIIDREFSRYAEQDSYDHMDMPHDIDDSQPEGMRLGKYIDAVEMPVSEVEKGEEVWLESLRGGFEPYRVCGFAEPPSLRGTGKWSPFVERCNAGEGRGVVLHNPSNFIRSTTVRVIRRRMGDGYPKGCPYSWRGYVGM